MRKLLKYQFLNSYKSFIAALSLIVIGYMLDYFWFYMKGNVVGLSYVTNIFAYCILIFYSIDSVVRLITKGHGMALYLVPIKKRKVFYSNILMFCIYLILLIIIILLQNLVIGHVPFIDNNIIKNAVQQIPLKSNIIINVFYFAWGLGCCLAIITTGVLIKIVVNVLFRNRRYKGFCEIFIFLCTLAIYIELMRRLMDVLDISKTVMLNSSLVTNMGIQQYTMLPYGNSSVLSVDYFNHSLSSIYINIGAVIFNFLWVALILLISSIIFDKKVDI